MDWIAIATGFYGLYLTNQMKSQCWLWFILSNLCWDVHWLYTATVTGYYETGVLTMNGCMLIMYTWNWWTWNRREKGHVAPRFSSVGRLLRRRLSRLF